jgi:hypothetical protein
MPHVDQKPLLRVRNFDEPLVILAAVVAAAVAAFTAEVFHIVVIIYKLSIASITNRNCGLGVAACQKCLLAPGSTARRLMPGSSTDLMRTEITPGMIRDVATALNKLQRQAGPQLAAIAPCSVVEG